MEAGEQQMFARVPFHQLVPPLPVHLSFDLLARHEGMAGDPMHYGA
jgi:hypothetical protein